MQVMPHSTCAAGPPATNAYWMLHDLGERERDRDKRQMNGAVDRNAVRYRYRYKQSVQCDSDGNQRDLVQQFATSVNWNIVYIAHQRDLVIGRCLNTL